MRNGPRRSAGRTRLEILARHRLLFDRLAEDKILPRFARDWRDYPEYLEMVLDRMLMAELGKGLPELAAFLSRDKEPYRQPERKKQLRPVLVRLLEEANRARPDRRPLLLLAADRVAAYLGPDDGPSGERPSVVAGHRLTYWLSEESWPTYRHDLLWTVWKEHRDTAWGEWAFVLLLNRAWNTADFCPRNGFREIIGRGEAFLAQRPKSPLRPYVLLALAQAYETWWSASQADDEDWILYHPGAIAARKKAIDAYQRVLRHADRVSPEGRYARRQLPRLILGLDTGQRYFYCFPH